MKKLGNPVETLKFELRPDGGNKGGMVVAEGTPEQIAATPASHTGTFLAPLLEGRAARQPARTRRKAG